MSLLDMQRAFSKLLTEESYLVWYLVDKGAALAEFDLTPSEASAIENLNAERLQRYSLMLVHNRLDLALKAIPRVRNVLGTTFFRTYSAEYARTYPPTPAKNDSPMMAEFKNLVPFLQKLVARGDIHEPFFAETLEWDSTLFLVGSDPRISALAEEFARGCGVAPAISPSSTPLLSPATAIRTFPVDIWNDSPTLEADRRSGPIHVLFQKFARDPAVRLTKLSNGTRCFLDLCDGQISVAAIAGKLSTEAGAAVEAVLENCLGMCKALVDRKVLGLPSADEHRETLRAQPRRKGNGISICAESLE